MKIGTLYIYDGNSEIPFLDIKVLMKDEEITTDVCYKPTNTHQYLQFNNCHPRHTKHNILYSQEIKICTTGDNTQTKEKRMTER